VLIFCAKGLGFEIRQAFSQACPCHDFKLVVRCKSVAEASKLQILAALTNMANVSVSFISVNRDVGGSCSTRGGNEKYMKILVKKSERKMPLGRPRRRWEDNIRIDRREVG